MAEVYTFNQNEAKQIYDYKRFTQVNSFGRAASNCVSDLTGITNSPDFASYKGVDILIKPRSISTYLAQSILSKYKLSSVYIDYIYRFYQNEPLVIPAEQIYSNNIRTAPDNNGINATKQFKFTHVKEICILFPRYVSDYTVQFNPCLEKLCLSMFNHEYLIMRPLR
jgi:hypothetical protein